MKIKNKNDWSQSWLDSCNLSPYLNTRGGYIHGGGGGESEYFLVMFWRGGVKIKIPWSRGVKYFIRYLEGGGVRCAPLVFAFIKSQSFWGPSP